MVAEAEAATFPEKTIQVRPRVFAEGGTQEAVDLSKALSMMLVVLRSKGKWTQFAAAHEAVDGKPGDCLFMPPACLMDLDEMSPKIAKSWRLAIGTLTHPEDKNEFTHCWLEFEDAAVSVSNLSNGYPLYAKTRADYYKDNKLVGEPVYVSARALRVAGRRLRGGADLAKFLANKIGDER